MRSFARFLLPAVAATIAIGAGTLSAQNVTTTAKQYPPETASSSSTTDPTDRATVGPQTAGYGGSSGASVQGAHPYFDRFVSGGAIEYGVANNRGVYVSEDGGQTWRLHDNGLPDRMVYPFNDRGIETITAIGVDPLNANRVAVTTSAALFASNDAGRSWTEVPLRPPVKSVAYITTVAVSPWSDATYAVGTSFSGVFETTDNGKSWKSYSDSLKFLYRGAGFYEEIAGAVYSPVQSDALYIGVGFGGGVYRSNADRSSWTSADFPVGTTQDSPAVGNGSIEVIRQMSSGLSDGRPVLSVATRSEYWKYDLGKEAWQAIGKPPAPPAVSAEKEKRLAVAADRSGLYLAAVNASGEHLQKMIELAKANGLNSLVVDVKDDFGRLTYDSQVPLARRIGAVHPFFNLKELIKVAHENGMYVVGRMVVFKDEQLYSYDNFKYAVWDKTKNKPWRNIVKEVNSKTDTVRQSGTTTSILPKSFRAWESTRFSLTTSVSPPTARSKTPNIVSNERGCPESTPSSPT